ncbi:uncharacterized protein LOC114843676 [Betta splendens]|uniref:Uncharacterized protein LOC114843676 n=1 Tax=Betta splendens TaxID=158456 RepID=A0A6P7L028_BETSP|nr:uncharacterized protein LOC114843676 [Betta splendens]
MLLLWLLVLCGRINTGTSSDPKMKQTATMNCTFSAQGKSWSCSNGSNYKNNGGHKTLTINLSAEQNGTNVTCRVNLTADIKAEKSDPLTLTTTLTSDLQNCTRNETQPTSDCTAKHPNKPLNESNCAGKPSWSEASMMMLLETVQKPEVISAFLIGFLLATLVSTVVCCMKRKSHRKKLKRYRNLSDALEMTYDPADAGPGTSAAVNSDVDYSTIKFSAGRAKKLGETTETEYAEIKREETVQEEDEGGSQGEGAILVEGEVEAESGGMMEDEDAALCPDVEVAVSENEAQCGVNNVQSHFSD